MQLSIKKREWAPEDSTRCRQFALIVRAAGVDHAVFRRLQADRYENAYIREWEENAADHAMGKLIMQKLKQESV